MLFANWLRWQNVVDFFVLSVAFYLVLLWAKQTRALHLALLIVGFHAAALWTEHFDLTITSWVFEGRLPRGDRPASTLIPSRVAAFAPPAGQIARFRFHSPAVASIRTYDSIVAAMFEMARSKIGALIVLTRKDSISNLVSNGVRIDAEVSQGLVEAIFRKDSPIHDGAVLIEGERIAFARLVLPLSGREDVPTEFGTRHRAALGLAGSSDALVLVASEERGQVVVMDGRNIHAMPDQATLRQALYSLHPDRAASIWSRVRRLLFANHPVSTLSGRAGGSDLGGVVPGRRDDGQDGGRSRGIRQCAGRTLHLQPTLKHSERPASRELMGDESCHLRIDGTHRFKRVGRGLAHHQAGGSRPETPARCRGGTPVPTDHFAPPDTQYRAPGVAQENP